MEQKKEEHPATTQENIGPKLSFDKNYLSMKSFVGEVSQSSSKIFSLIFY